MKRIVIVVWLGLLLVVAWVLLNKGSGRQADGATIIQVSDQQLFLPECLYAEASSEQTDIPPQLIAGLGPHHLPPAAGLLKTLYSTIARNRPDISTVLLLGPNHFAAGQAAIITAAVSYETSLGMIATDTDLLAALLATGLVADESEPFAAEHAIYAHLPFIQTYLPDVRIVPLIFRYDMSRQQARDLGRWLAENLADDVVVVLSTDLSHYQPAELADKEDEQTIAALTELQTELLADIRFDAEPAAWTLFTYLRARGVERGYELGRSNSADQGGDPESTTGYAVIVY